MLMQISAWSIFYVKFLKRKAVFHLKCLNYYSRYLLSSYEDDPGDFI